MKRFAYSHLFLLFLAAAACGDEGDPGVAGHGAIATSDPVRVSGSGIHYFSTAVIHSSEETDTGMIQRSTDIIELTGDLEGKVLYHPVSVFDFAAQTLVNTGEQVFSGSVLGSDPVLLYDNEFRFEVNLETGATVGRIFLRQSQDATGARWYECDLDVVGTGMTEAGDALAEYDGTCVSKSR